VNALLNDAPSLRQLVAQAAEVSPETVMACLGGRDLGSLDWLKRLNEAAEHDDDLRRVLLATDEVLCRLKGEAS
jgi:hypothetical protein